MVDGELVEDGVKEKRMSEGIVGGGKRAGERGAAAGGGGAPDRKNGSIPQRTADKALDRKGSANDCIPC